MNTAVVKGAKRSRTVWLGALTALAGLGVVAGPVTAVFGPQAAGVLLIVSGVATVFVRALTTESLEEKGRGEEA